jgi:predicted metal-dependent peptidase
MNAATAPAAAARERQRVSCLRMQLLEAHPFWGHLLLQLELVPDTNLRHMAATDCVRTLWYNPDETSALSDAALGFVLAHEVGHMAYATRERQRGRDAMLWNCATDYAINRIVAAIPDPLRLGQPMYMPPEGILLDRRFDGLTAEAIYERLCAAPGQLANLAVHDDWVDGLPVHGHGGGLDAHLPGELDEADRETLDEMLRAAAAHWVSSGRHGHIPGEVLRDLGDAQSRVPWRRLLRAFVGATLTVDELDPHRPHRRWLAQDVYRPGPGGERIGLVVIALDSSGSMSRPLLTAACAELRAITAHTADARVVVADAKVQESFPLEQVEPWLAQRRIKGGGGTDHRPVFDWVAAQHLQPDVLIAFTDLLTTFPAQRPHYPVLWLAPPGAPTPPFGRVITLVPD